MLFPMTGIVSCRAEVPRRRKDAASKARGDQYESTSQGFVFIRVHSWLKTLFPQPWKPFGLNWSCFVLFGVIWSKKLFRAVRAFRGVTFRTTARKRTFSGLCAPMCTCVRPRAPLSGKMKKSEQLHKPHRTAHDSIRPAAGHRPALRASWINGLMGAFFPHFQSNPFINASINPVRPPRWLLVPGDSSLCQCRS